MQVIIKKWHAQWFHRNCCGGCSVGSGAGDQVAEAQFCAVLCRTIVSWILISYVSLRISRQLDDGPRTMLER